MILQSNICSKTIYQHQGSLMTAQQIKLWERCLPCPPTHRFLWTDFFLLPRLNCHMISCCRQVSCSVASLEFQHVDTWQKNGCQVWKRGALGTQDLWLEGHLKPTDRVFSSARCPTLLHLHDSLFATPDFGIFWPLITIRTITWSCAKSGFKNWTFTCRLLHPVGFFSLTYSSAAFAIWNHHQFGRKIHQKPRGPGQNEVGFGGIFQRLCSQSKMPLRVWELNCLEEPPNWKDSYGWNDWNSTETAWNFCRHHPQFTPESLVRMGPPINSTNWNDLATT